jgi:hypothetical protein
MSKETKDLAIKQYMVLAKIKGDTNEILNLATTSANLLSQSIDKNQVIADRMFDLMLSFANDISETIKEYLASKADID